MKLNKKFYKEDNDTVSKIERSLIENYINKYDISDYEDVLSEEVSFEQIKYLTSTSQNLLNWYQFKKVENVLEIGGNLGELTGVFCEKCKTVTTIEPSSTKANAIAKRYNKKDNLEIIIGALKNISLDKKFDIIILIGVEERVKEIFGETKTFKEIVSYLEKYLNPNGKFIIAVDNKFGLRYFAGNPENIFNRKFESLIGYNNEPEKIETFTKSKLEKEIEELGYKANFYYPLPDYKMPNVIFSDKQLPEYNSVDKYNPYVNENSDILFNEVDVFREILKTNEEMFPFFTNSFLIEISKSNIDIKYKYISFNNLRKPKYRLITKITDDYVEKQKVNEKSSEHYENIKENIKILQQNNIKMVDYVEDNIIKSKYIKQEKLLNNVLTKVLEEKDIQKFDKILGDYISLYNQKSFKIQDYKETIFNDFDINVEDEELIKQMHFIKNGLWDMTFKNCFYIDDDFYFFDQEWNEKNVPVEYILYRSIVYTISLRRFINIEELLKKYDLEKYRKIFIELDNKLQEKVRDKKIWEYYNKNKFIDIDSTKQEMINLNIRSKAQQGAIDNMKSEIEELKKLNAKVGNELTSKNNELQQLIDSQFKNRVKRKIRKIIGGNNG